MSKLLAMIMSKKPQYMNLSVVGNPTISSGVVSNFSASNYIELDNFDNIGTNDIEFCFKYTPTTLKTTRLFATADSGSTFTGLVVGNSSPYFRFFVYGNSTQYIVASSVVAQANTDYYIIGYRKGNKIGIKISTDGINYTTNEDTIPDNLSLTNASKFYAGLNKNSSASYIDGSIDFYSSYIKIGNIKYNFQFTMPLTVIGSPTIVDGIVSGFSSSDYLKSSVSIDFYSNNNKSIEIFTKITTGNTINGCGIISSLDYGNGCGGIIIGGSKLTTMIYYYNGTTNKNSQCNSSITLQANTTYYAKSLINLENGYCEIYVSTDNINWTKTSKSNSDYVHIVSHNYIYGIGKAQNGIFNGSINIYKSYITLDGTKYIFTLP